ncbi:hypothetical protein ACOSP7_001500 [Xanthoceras sorbifolium]
MHAHNRSLSDDSWKEFQKSLLQDKLLNLPYIQVLVGTIAGLIYKSIFIPRCFRVWIGVACHYLGLNQCQLVDLFMRNELILFSTTQ